MNMLLLALPTHGTGFQVFSNILEIVVVFSLLKGALHYPYFVSKQKRIIAAFLMLVFVVFSFWGADWFHYYESYFYLRGGERGHMEPIYVWIAKHLSFNYYSFRLVIWGLSLLLVIDLFNRLSVNRNLAMLFFGTIWILWFSYARVSAAITLALWGLSLLYHPFKKQPHIVSYLLGVAAMAASLVFHKTALFIIVVILLSYFTIKINNSWLIGLLVVFVLVFYALANNFLDLFFALNGDFTEDGVGQVIASGQYYLSSDESQQGIGLRLSNTLEQLSFFLVAFQCLLYSVKETSKPVPIDVQMFIRITLFIVLISILFSFTGGINSGTLYRRFLRFSQLSSAIVFSFFWERNRFRSLNRLTLSVGLLSTFYTLGYQWYLAL